jgi:hypothetical protein
MPLLLPILCHLRNHQIIDEGSNVNECACLLMLVSNGFLLTIWLSETEITAADSRCTRYSYIALA